LNKGITCAGNIIVDQVKEIEAYPQPGNLTTITSVSQSLGGLATIFLPALRALDESLPLCAVGLVGDDGPGEWAKTELEKTGIDTRWVGRHPSLGTSFTDVMSQSGKERTFFHYRGANAALSPAHVPLDELNPGILHMGYILLLDAMDARDAEFGTVMARVLAGARARGLLTCVDAVSEQGERHREKVPPALRHADFCVLNEFEAGQATGIPLRGPDGSLLRNSVRRVCEEMKAMGVRRWAAVHAPEGAFGVDEAGRYLEQPSLRLPPEAIAGKTGAGDAFAAGVLHTALMGGDLAQALKQGCRASASRILRPDRGGGPRAAARLMELDRMFGFREWGQGS
jgi:sugar/nucleoside kinase (ribokinase family)